MRISVLGCSLRESFDSSAQKLYTCNGLGLSLQNRQLTDFCQNPPPFYSKDIKEQSGSKVSVFTKVGNFRVEQQDL